MKGKCGDCPAYEPDPKWCRALSTSVESWWTGCRIEAETWVRQHPGGKE